MLNQIKIMDVCTTNRQILDNKRPILTTSSAIGKEKVNNHKGQNFVEYLVLVVAVIIVLIFFLGPTGLFRGALERSLEFSFFNQIKDMTQTTTFNIQGRSYSNSL